VDDVTEKAQWLKTTRKERGWSADTLAQAVLTHAAARGVELSVSQQAVSYFENGNVKNIPPWYKWAEAILLDRQDLPQPPPAPPPVLTVNLPIPLGTEEALSRMFEGLLAGLDRDAPRASQARLLARKLPIALSSLRDLRSVSETPSAPPSASSEADADLAIANPAPRP
jgi:transcriptional regulator with XRE-family HTH domain